MVVVVGNVSVVVDLGSWPVPSRGPPDSGHKSPAHQVTLKVARVLCGGELEPGSLVDENWFIELERREFMNLLRNDKTQARIAHTLATGKPLRN